MKKRNFAHSQLAGLFLACAAALTGLVSPLGPQAFACPTAPTTAEEQQGYPAEPNVVRMGSIEATTFPSMLGAYRTKTKQTIVVRDHERAARGLPFKYVVYFGEENGVKKGEVLTHVPLQGTFFPVRVAFEGAAFSRLSFLPGAPRAVVALASSYTNDTQEIQDIKRQYILALKALNALTETAPPMLGAMRPEFIEPDGTLLYGIGYEDRVTWVKKTKDKGVLINTVFKHPKFPNGQCLDGIEMDRNRNFAYDFEKESAALLERWTKKGFFTYHSMDQRLIISRAALAAMLLDAAGPGSLELLSEKGYIDLDKAVRVHAPGFKGQAPGAIADYIERGLSMFSGLSTPAVKTPAQTGVLQQGGASGGQPVQPTGPAGSGFTLHKFGETSPLRFTR